jgi:hypothetical protein
MSRIVTLSAAALFAGLAGLLSMELASGAAPVVSPSHVAAASQVAAQPGPARRERLDQDGRRILARPLFSVDRAAPVAAVAVVAQAVAAPPPPLPRLSAVVTHGTDRYSIFAAPAGGRPLVLPEGGSVGPYTVVAIAPGEVTVRGPYGVTQVRPSADSAASSSGSGSDAPPHG